MAFGEGKEQKNFLFSNYARKKSFLLDFESYLYTYTKKREKIVRVVEFPSSLSLSLYFNNPLFSHLFQCQRGEPLTFDVNILSVK